MLAFVLTRTPDLGRGPVRRTSRNEGITSQEVFRPPYMGELICVSQPPTELAGDACLHPNQQAETSRNFATVRYRCPECGALDMEGRRQ